MENNTTKFSITINPELIDKINEKNYNRNKLLISLLKEYIKNKQK